MAKNYLIGIGGTGSRVIEAMTYLCASGYGPDDLSVFIIDPDKGNGNLVRTKNLLTLYMRCKKVFEPTARTKEKLFKTRLSIPDDPEKLVWDIFANKGTTLGGYIKYDNLRDGDDAVLRDFVSVLFSDVELNTALDEGFRGHPAIGSVVMSQPPQDQDPWKKFFADIATEKANGARVFLVGSIFGGTGAAGVPTMGSEKLIKFHPNAAIDNQSRVLLGGALVLPYFTFDTEKTTEKMFVTGADFPIATKAALQFYNEKELGFDHLYFIGDSLNQKVGKFGVGSATQENMPHYIELVTALAAVDFFEQPEVKGVPDKKYFIACREGDTVQWDNLPVSRSAELIKAKQDTLKARLVSMTAFSYAFATYGMNVVRREEQIKKELDQPWYKSHFKFDDKKEDTAQNPHRGTNEAQLKDAETFARLFLAWTSGMDDGTPTVGLINRKKLIDGNLEVGQPFTLFDPEKEKANIGALLKEASKKPLNMDNFKASHLNATDLKKETSMSAANKYLNLFYEASVKFCTQAYDTKSE